MATKKTLDEIRLSLSLADERVSDIRFDMESDIRNFMESIGKDSIEVKVHHNCEVHPIIITKVSDDEDERLLFEDKRDGISELTIEFYQLSTDLLAGVCMSLLS